MKGCDIMGIHYEEAKCCQDCFEMKHYFYMNPCEYCQNYEYWLERETEKALQETHLTGSCEMGNFVSTKRFGKKLYR